VIFWFFSENFLRFFNINESYNEKLTGTYSSGFIVNNKIDKNNPHLCVRNKNSSFIEGREEFSYIMKYNSEGLRDVEHNIQRVEKEYRIICLGNSYTEGIGTPADSTWPKLLEEKLNKSSKRRIEVFNAGISGSDPFFEFMLLKEKMLKYRPNIVLVALGSSDFNFYRFRGGFERFTRDGYHYRKGPKWERFYALSYVFRFFLNDIFHYKHKFLLSPTDYKFDSIKADRDIENCVFRFNELAKKEKFKLIMMLIDDKGGERYSFLIKKLKKENTISVINLIEYNKNNEKLSKEDLEKYYWPIDGHCKPTGYELMAKGVYWNLNKMGIIDSINKE
jgi:lysophospholipase L1-like esterase